MKDEQLRTMFLHNEFRNSIKLIKLETQFFLMEEKELIYRFLEML